MLLRKKQLIRLDQRREKMQDKLKKRVEKQLKKIEKNRHYINYYDINSIRDCYITLKECLKELEYRNLEYSLLDKINFNIKVSNNIIKRSII